MVVVPLCIALQTVANVFEWVGTAIGTLIGLLAIVFMIFSFSVGLTMSRGGLITWRLLQLLDMG